jgi:hypothetical protein
MRIVKLVGGHNAATRWRFTAQVVGCVVAAVLLTVLATLGARYLFAGG